MVLWIQVKNAWFFSLFWENIYIPFTEMIDPDDAGRAKQRLWRARSQPKKVGVEMKQKERSINSIKFNMKTQ